MWSFPVHLLSHRLEVSQCEDTQDKLLMPADQILNIRRILERKWEHNEAVHQLFTDFKKAYDSVRREGLYNFLTVLVISMKLESLMEVCRTETYSRPG